jgi:hypothetical protein
MAAAHPLTVLYYPTGVVHLRNLETLRRLPGCRFRVIIEPWLAALPAGTLAAVEPADRLAVRDNRLPAEAWTGVDLLFFCMAYPNRFRLELAREAARRGIPALAVEEVNQLALNDNRINHYVLPLDWLGAASEEERRRFVDLGWPPESVTVTGWPFLQATGEARRRIPNEAGRKKSCLLVLGSLKERDIVSLETRAVRRAILQIVTDGLPADWQLLIKPHPLERADTLAAIRSLAPRAHLLDPRAAIEPLLEAADLVVNRGNSQVALTAMRLDKPLAVLPVGLNTVFHGALDEVIAGSAADLARLAARAEAGAHPDYASLLALHWPLNEAESLRRVGELFAAAQERGGPRVEERMLHLALAAAVVGEKALALELLSGAQSGGDGARLSRLIACAAGEDDIAALQMRFPGGMVRRHLQALLTRWLVRRRPVPGDLDRLDGFDGGMNVHGYLEDLLRRIELELGAGRRTVAEQLLARLEPEYAGFPFYRQAFAMLRFTYSRDRHAGLRRWLWLLGHAHTPWARRVVGGWLRKK